MKWISSPVPLMLSGQALPLCIAVVFLSVIVAILVGNTAQTSADKTRVINAADAAAYSALVWQARALNFQAYANRAMVANQVAIAQAVSLQAWSVFSQVAADNLDEMFHGEMQNNPASIIVASGTANPQSALVAQTLSGVSELIQVQPSSTEALAQVQQAVAPLINQLVTTASEMNAALSRLQQDVHVSGVAETQNIVQQVVAANDVNMQVNAIFATAAIGENAQQWEALTGRYEAPRSDAMRSRADVIYRSLDRFSSERHRDYSKDDDTALIHGSSLLYQRGATKPVLEPNEGASVQWQWRAKDTLSLNTNNSEVSEQDPGSEIPLGWGQARTTPSNSTALATNGCASVADACTPWFDRTRQAEHWSDAGYASLGGNPSLQGVAVPAGFRAFRSLKQPPDVSTNTPLTLHVQVNLPSEKSQVSKNAGGSGANLLNLNQETLSVAALASAEVYFEHPEDPMQLPNLYQPYWDVRLITTPEVLRQRSWATRQSLELPSTNLPRTQEPGRSLSGKRSDLPPYLSGRS